MFIRVTTTKVERGAKRVKVGDQARQKWATVALQTKMTGTLSISFYT
jgi:hypothetical protein